MEPASSSDCGHGLEWHSQWDISGTVSWIEGRGFTRVTLQFPDGLLKESTVVAAAIQQECTRRDIVAQVSVLADTSYNSLSVDEVAAQHAQADCVVHYGRASMSPLSCLPAYFVFGQHNLDIPACAERIAKYAADKAHGSDHSTLLVFLDQALLHAIGQLQESIQSIQQNYSSTLQIVFADVKLRSLDPPSIAPPQSGSTPKAATCSCKVTSTGSVPISTTASQSISGVTTLPPPATGACPVSTAARPSAEPQHDLHMSVRDNDAAVGDSDQRPVQSADTGSTLAGSAMQPPEEQASSSGSIAGYSWQLPSGAKQAECIMVWVGPSDVPALTHLHLTFNKLLWVMYDPEHSNWQEGLPLDISKTLKRRYFLVEKAKNANVIGILVGTLGVAGYKDAIDSIRRLAKNAGKKTYTMLMGKPNPAKLANFPEVEIFVMVADPQGMILDSKEYYAPIITPYEAHMAFSGDAEWNGDYSLDFSSLQGAGDGGVKSEQTSQHPRFSLLDGAYHAHGHLTCLDNGVEAEGMQVADQGISTALARRADQALQLTGNDRQVTSASEYLQKRRTYTGLEAPIVGADSKPVIKAIQGQVGRAAQYQHEQGR